MEYEDIKPVPHKPFVFGLPTERECWACGPGKDGGATRAKSNP
jgi:hypothetical protein